jgi:cytochrome c biogenesis protein CcmG, thiol:disulfide interchange protein DsbE
VTPVPGWRGRFRALRSTRLVLAVSVVAAAAVALIVVGATAGAGAPATQHLGRAKNFTLGVLGHPGRQLSLQSMTGHPVIVNFFASWCEPCQKETPLIARFYRARQGHVAIIGVDVNDSAAKATAFVRKSGVTYPVAVDPMPMKAAIAYNLPGLPATFFLNAQHIIVKRVYGPVTEAELASGARLMTGRS